MKTKNLIFDIDGTLWDTTGVVAEAWNAAIKKATGREGGLTADILKKEFGKTMQVIADDLFTFLPEEERMPLMDLCCEYEHEYLEKCTDDLTYPGVKEMFKEMYGQYGVYIVSNCQCGYIELFMAKNGVEQYVTDFECYGGTLLDKGSNIRLLMERNNLEEAIYIGDTMGDYEASVKAQVPFVHVTYGFGRVETPDAVIGAMGELKNILE